MKNELFLFVSIFLFLVFLSIFSLAETPFTDPSTLRGFLPVMKGYSVFGNDFVTKLYIDNNSYPFAMRTYVFGGQRITVQIIDGHYEPPAYQKYFFYVDMKKSEDEKIDQFYSVIIAGQTIYVHRKVELRSIKGIALIGNRYLVEVNANPSTRASDISPFFEKIDFIGLANTNNPESNRNLDLRMPKIPSSPDEKPKVLPNKENDSEL